MNVRSLIILELTAGEIIKEQASLETVLNSVNSKLIVSLEHIHILEECENSKVTPKEFKFSLPKTLCDQPSKSFLYGDAAVKQVKVPEEKEEPSFEKEQTKTAKFSGDMALKNVMAQKEKHEESLEDEKFIAAKFSVVAIVLASSNGIRKQGDINDANSGGSVSSPSSASSDNSLYNVKSPDCYSDVSDADSKPQLELMPDEAWQYRSHKIPVYVDDEGNNHLKRVSVFGLYECFGYYTFAGEIKAVCTEEDIEIYPLAHVSWPWAPCYSRAEYYAKKPRGRPILLDPLTLSWDSFATRLTYVVMKEKRGTTVAQELGDGVVSPFIPLQIYKEEMLEMDLRITRSVIQGFYKSLLRVLYLYTCAYRDVDPNIWDMMPVDPWLPIAACFFLSEAGVHLEPPQVESSTSEDQDSTDDAESGADVVDVNSDHGASGGESEDSTADELEIEDVNIQAAVEWEDFLTRLACIEFRIVA